MKLGFKAKALLIAASLAVGGVAHANTSINVTTTGSVFMNLLDSVTGSSYVFDTGLTQATFSENAFYQYNLTGDANYQAFISAAGADLLQWNVISADGNNPIGTSNALSTIVSFSGTTRNSGLNNAMLSQQGYADGLNNWASSTTNSAFVNTSSDPASAGTPTGAWGVGLQASHLGTIGTALQFYSIAFAGTNRASPSTSALRTLLAQAWTLGSDGFLTYGTQTQAPVPLPAPLMLLMSGLALMGVIGRRGNKTEGPTALAAA